MITPGGALTGPLFAALLDQLSRAPRALPRGHVIGPYRIMEPLGHGGSAVVYLAERGDGEFDQLVALKVIAAAPTSVEHSRRERQILASLHHAHIARLLDGGSTDDGLIWFAMEPVRGTRIDRYVADRALDLAQRLRLFLDVCDAVRFAHARLVIHRDLKPSNILVSDDGEVKLLDFGIAMFADAADARPAAMTPAYASPEQRRGDPITTASDIWQLGNLLALLTSDLRRGRGLAAVIARATQPDPAARYDHASELAADLTRLTRRQPVIAYGGGVGYRAACLFARHRIASAATAAFATVIVAMVLHFAARLARERDAVMREATRANATASFVIGLFDASDPASSRGRTFDADMLLDTAARRLRDELGAQPALRGQLLLAIGRIEIRLGQPAKARPLFEEAIQALRAAGDPDPGPLSEALAGEGAALLNLGNPRAALDALRDSAALAGDDRARRGPVLDLLSMAQLGAGRFAEAIATQREAVALARAEHGAESAETAASLQNLGIVLRGRDTAADSLRAFEQAWQIYRRVRGVEHPATAAAQQLYAVALMDQGRLDEAHPLLEAAVELQRRLLHGKGTSFGHALRALGRLRAKEGDHRAAIERFLEAEVQYRDTGEERSVTLAYLFHATAESYAALDDHANALRYHERALAIRRERAPGQHTLAQSLEGCSRALVELGRAADAEVRAREALAIRTVLVSASSPDLAASLLPLGAARRAQGAPDEAHNLWQRALEVAARGDPTDLAAAKRYVARHSAGG
jgi:tetratricopeptide (TPR) repeat protein